MRCRGCRFQVAPGTDLTVVARELAKHGVKSERASGISPGVAEAVVFSDPKGTMVEVFADYVFAKDDGRQAGVMPLKLGHVAYRVDDVQKHGKILLRCARLSRLRLARRPLCVSCAAIPTIIR